MQSTIDGRRKWLVLLLIAAFVVSLSALTAFWFAHRVDKSAHSRVSSNSVSDATLTRSFIPDKHIQNKEAQHQEWCWALHVGDADLLTSSSSEDAKCT